MPHFDPLSLLDEPASSTPSSGRPIPNLHPRITNVPYRLAIIGEAPGVDEEEQGRPFVGWSGKDLDRFLSRFGIVRDACFVGNVCQIRPPGNKIAAFDWDGPEIQGGIRQLTDDLKNFRPNCLLLLGGSALHAFMVPNIIPKKRKTKDGLVFVFPNTIGDWRGSFFGAHLNSPCPSAKCIAAYHPAACMRQYEWTPLLMMDIKRAFDDATFPDLRLPQRTLKVVLSFDQTVRELEDILAKQSSVGTDIEGYWNNWRSISFAPTPEYAFAVPWVDMRGQSYWTEEQEVVLLDLVSQIISHPKIVKTWQNGLYDRFVMHYGYSIVARGPNPDIMLKHWELYCELEKSLAMQASLYTKEPYYKSEIKSNDLETFLRYNCKDSAITKEIDLKIDRWLKPDSRRHYDFNITLLNALLYMELRGLRYDHAKAKLRLTQIEEQLGSLQNELNHHTNRGLGTTDRVMLRNMLRDVMCWKRDPSKVKSDKAEDYAKWMPVLSAERPLSASELGSLSLALGKSINVDSSKQLQAYLYEDLRLPEQRNPQTKARTADYDALIKLRKHSDHPALPVIIEMTELLTRAGMLRIKHDPDGRIRSSYNEVGSETGRVTSLTSPTGSGYNLQTLPDENELKPTTSFLHLGMRDLVVADPGCYLAKCDLKGADGWTVGANLASLGDTTMLDDLRFGLKPASILCYAWRHGAHSVIGKSRPELAALCKEVKKSDWDYFAAKQCIWGFCYLMGIRKAKDHIFHVSEGTVAVTEDQVKKLRDMLLARYRISLWWRAMEQRLFNQPYPPKLTSPSGHTRMFFGRKTDIVGQALAHEPQSVTTFATNTSVYKCWTDPDNRISETLRGQDGRVSNELDSVRSRIRLRIEPLHQVHDEALFQFRIEDTTWAVAKIQSWFATPIKIAGVEVTIPADGSYGTDWAMNEHSKVGSI